MCWKTPKKQSKKQEWFNCDKCDGQFKFKSELKKHMPNYEQVNTVNKREFSTSPADGNKKKIKEDLESNILPLGNTSVVEKKDTVDPNQVVVQVLAVENGGNVTSIHADDAALEHVANVNQPQSDMKMETDEKNDKIEELSKELVKQEKEFKEKYNGVVIEMEKMSEELIKVQKERDLAQAKLEVFEQKEKKERYEKTLILFEHGGDLMIDLQDNEKEEVDECILSIKCQGDCDPVVHQAEQTHEAAGRTKKVSSGSIRKQNSTDLSTVWTRISKKCFSSKAYK